jgi:hypothetical protein
MLPVSCAIWHELARPRPVRDDDAEGDSWDTGTAPKIANVPIGGGGEGLARAQADLVRLRAGEGEVRRPGWVYAVMVLVIVIPLVLLYVLVTLLT